MPSSYKFPKTYMIGISMLKRPNEEYYCPHYGRRNNRKINKKIYAN